jgi:hypothetical protein
MGNKEQRDYLMDKLNLLSRKMTESNVKYVFRESYWNNLVFYIPTLLRQNMWLNHEVYGQHRIYENPGLSVIICF